MPNPDVVMIIPAAGSGTRLQSPVPKALTPVSGRPMIDHLLGLYRNHVRRFVVVVHPSFESAVREHCAGSSPDLDIRYATQPQPTGMLDAILLAAPASTGSGRVWITWCDQIGISPRTVSRLQRTSDEHTPAMALPTTRQQQPYIHLVRDSAGRITGVLQRREGDAMPAVGESDMGLFSLSPDAYFNRLPSYGREAGAAGTTGERNFLPFLPWLEQRGYPVVTFPCTEEIEALGINTPEDLRRMEQHLSQRDAS